MFKQFIFVLYLFSILLICGCDDGSDSLPAATLTTPPSDCFWTLELTPGTDESDNRSLPDLNTAYWLAIYNLPEDALYFTVEDMFPYSRYMSFVTYQISGETIDILVDKEISPNLGSTNPFIPGNARNDPSRIYTVTIRPGDEKEPAKFPNENALSTPYGFGALMHRVYLPDAGTDAAGVTGPPRVTLYMADGGILQGDEACDVISPLEPGTPLSSDPLYGPTEYIEYRESADPAKDPPAFRATYDFLFHVQCDFGGDCSTKPSFADPGFALPDPRYLYSFISRKHGEVLVLRAKLPETPDTSNGEDVAIEGQVRYWSLCNYEYIGERAESCLHDDQIQVNEDGYYTIVVSRQEDFPDNATADCGVSHLGWSDNGDGFGSIEGYENYPDDGFLLLRNILPSADFTQAVPNSDTLGEEGQMEDYLPKGRYFSKAEFESLGCNPWLTIPYSDM